MWVVDQGFSQDYWSGHKKGTLPGYYTYICFLHTFP